MWGRREIYKSRRSTSSIDTDKRRAREEGYQAGRAEILDSLKAWVQARRNAPDMTTLGQITEWAEDQEQG